MQYSKAISCAESEPLLNVAATQVLERIQRVLGNAPSYTLEPFEKIHEISLIIGEYEEVVSKLQNSPEKEPFVLPVESSESKDMIASIRAAFGFTTKDLAEVLRVDRQTIYAWIRSENDPSDENNRRIRSLLTLAEEWNSLSNLPVKKFLRTEFLNDGATLFGELCRETLDFGKIRLILRRAANLCKEIEEQKRRNQHHKTIIPRCSEYDMITQSAFIPKESE